MWLRNPTPSHALVVSFLLALVAWRLTAAPGDAPESSLEEALEALQAGRVDEARQQLEVIVDKWPGYRRAQYHLGRLAFDRGDLEEAHRLLQRGVAGDFPRAYSAWYYLGRTRILQREFSAAVEALDGALERAPGFGPARMERGRAHLFLGDVEAGLADLLTTLELADPPRQAAVLTSQLLIRLGRNDEAGMVVQDLIDRSKGEERWSRRARWLQLALDANAAARRELGRAVEKNPEAGDLYWAMDTVYLAKDPGRSTLLFRIALDHDSENPVSLLTLEQLQPGDSPVTTPTAMPLLRSALIRAGKLWEDGSYKEGRQIAERLLEQRPGLVPAHLLIAADAERLGDLWQAAWIYERLLEWLGPVPSIGRDLAEVAKTMGAQDLATCGIEMALDGDSTTGSLYYLLGGIEAGRGETEAAIAAYEKALKLGFEDVRTWLRLGELYFEQMNISGSIAAYEKAMAMDPAAAEAVRSFALSSLTTEQYTSLREILETHNQQHPENINTLYSLGVMSLRDNRLEEAEEYFLRLAEVAPDHRQVHYNLGQILLRQGDTVAGQAEMERFRQLKIAEDEEWEEHNQAHFRRVEARKMMESGEPEEAIPLYTESVRDGTAVLSDYLELANANLAAGRAAAALQGYEGILESFPYDRSALEGLVEAATRTGEQMKQEDTVDRLKILDWPCEMIASEKRGKV